MSLNVLTKLGDDALANLFNLNFAQPPGVTKAMDTALRVTTVTIPDILIGTYEVHYKTQKMTKKSGKIETANEFPFTFRVDKNWEIYEGLREWSRWLGDPDTGIMTPDFEAGIASLRVPVSVVPVDAEDNITGAGWVFEGCFISGLTGITFDVTSGEPLEVTGTLQFIKMI